MSNTPTPPKPLAPGDRQLTRHFRLSEFAVSASHPHLVRPVPPALIPRVTILAEQLQLVRDRLGMAMRITSGYRSTALNEALDGSPTSQHVAGQAADWHTHDMRQALVAYAELIAADQLVHSGQIIWYPEDGFIHHALVSPRFPHPTFCVHWPEQGWRYKKHAITPETAYTVWPGDWNA